MAIDVDAKSIPGRIVTSRLPRIVVKDRGLGWFAPRMWAYRQPALARWYLGRKR